MSDRRDTIAAVASGAGRAGIGVIRVSGTHVPAIAQKILGASMPAREAQYLSFNNSEGDALDVGIAIRFESPHSYTGEDVLELQGHGGPVVLDLVLARVLECGARIARPGEFTERAFLNDKLDLAQAEAVSDLIDSSSQAAALAAVRSMSGEFSAAVTAIRDELIALRVWLEAALDFSEEDIDFLSNPQLTKRANVLIERFDALMSNASQGQKLRDGLTVVIAGRTNVGKSSLLNVLSGTDSAIVTDVEGTTRDVLHEELVLEGLPLHIIDTAGLRETDDVVERIGIERAEKAIASADHVLVLVDVSDAALPDMNFPTGIPRTFVFNKTDLVDDKRQLARTVQKVLVDSDRTHLLVSAKSGEGVDQLRAHLLSLAGRDRSLEGVYLARRRHLDALIEARVATDSALTHLNNATLPELAAEEFRLAMQALDGITGTFDSEDLLGEIFSSFCIGK